MSRNRFLISVIVKIWKIKLDCYTLSSNKVFLSHWSYNEHFHWVQNTKGIFFPVTIFCEISDTVDLYNLDTVVYATKIAFALTRGLKLMDSALYSHSNCHNQCLISYIKCLFWNQRLDKRKTSICGLLVSVKWQRNSVTSLKKVIIEVLFVHS
jgi:hypothetical protein